MVPDVQTGGDLHEAVKEIPRLGIGGAPDFFEVLVRVEEASFVEDVDAFSEKLSNLLVVEVRMKILCWHGSAGVSGVASAAPMSKPKGLVSLEGPDPLSPGEAATLGCHNPPKNRTTEAARNDIAAFGGPFVSILRVAVRHERRHLVGQVHLLQDLAIARSGAQAVEPGISGPAVPSESSFCCIHPRVSVVSLPL